MNAKSSPRFIIIKRPSHGKWQDQVRAPLLTPTENTARFVRGIHVAIDVLRAKINH